MVVPHLKMQLKKKVRIFLMNEILFHLKPILNLAILGDDIVDLPGDSDEDEDSYEDVFDDENEDDFIA